MIEIPSFDNLVSLIQSCSCDLRRSLLTLQFFVQSSAASVCCPNQVLTNNYQPKLLNYRIFDTISYSYLSEKWNESILKTHFDRLTTKYTIEYEQFYRLLMNQINNDSKR